MWWAAKAAAVVVFGCVVATTLVVVAIGLLAVSGGCAEWSVRDRQERLAAEAGAAETLAAEAVADAESIAAARAEAVGAGGVVDQDKLVAALSARVRDGVLADLAARVAAGTNVVDAADAARKDAAARAAEQVRVAASLRAEARKAEAERGVARARDDRSWGLVEWGLTLGGAVGVPGLALLAGHLGRLRGMTQGATQAAQLVGTARSVDPDIDDAFRATGYGPVLRQSLSALHPRVREAIEKNKTTPLPDASATVTAVLAQAVNAGEVRIAGGGESAVESRVEIDQMWDELRDVQAKLAAATAAPGPVTAPPGS